MTPDAHHTERLELLCILDRDQGIPPSRAICSGCADTHEQSRFSKDLLGPCSRERVCLGKDGRIWLCPHSVFDYTQSVAIRSLPAYHQCGQNEAHIDLFPSRPRILWPSAVLDMDNSAPSKDFVETTLALSNLPICRHLRFHDLSVSWLYSPHCKKLRRGLLCFSRPPECFRSSCSWEYSQPKTDGLYIEGTGGWYQTCGTSDSFPITTRRKDRSVLQIIVRRTPIDFRRCTDDAWIEDVFDPANFQDFEQT